MNKNVKEMCDYVIYALDPKRRSIHSLGGFEMNVRQMAKDILATDQMAANGQETTKEVACATAIHAAVIQDDLYP